MIYTIGGIKGGSGKSTIATNLAIMLSLAGRDVLLVDADDQETATDFTFWRTETRGEKGTGYTAIQLSNMAVRTQVMNLKEKYDDIVIDTGGRDTTSQRAALAVSDIFVVPFIPRSFDIWTLEKVVTLVEEMTAANPALKAVAVLNKTDPKGSDNDDARGLLSEDEQAKGVLRLIDTPLGHRKAYANAAAKGLSVVELRPKDQKAIDEVEKLYNVITNLK